jgi:serine protease Do
VLGGVVSGFIIRKDILEKTENDNPVVTTGQSVLSETTTNQPEVTTVSGADTTNQQNIVSGTSTSSDQKPSVEQLLTATDIYEQNVDSVVSIEVRNRYSVGYGTGFIISEYGYIVTNYHVVEGAETVLVALYDETVYTAEIIGYEEANDLAVIKIEPDGKIESLVYGVSSDLKVGDDVYIIGNPLGDLTFTLTKGVVSALNRLVNTESMYSINMFQTDAAINSGNSGGPVFDKHGFVVGIASAKYASASIEGLGFCVPIDDVRSMIDEIINNGYVTGKPLIGVSVYDKEITNFGFLQSSRSVNGAKIAAIGEGSAAATAGLLINDIITAVNGETIKTVSELKTALASYRSGDKITLTVNRSGTQKQIELVLDEYEPSAPRTNYSNVYDL